MKNVRFEQGTSVPEFEKLLISPDLSKNALKGLVLHYERNRTKMEEQLKQSKRQYEDLKSQKSETTQVNELEKELNQFRNDSSTIRSLQAQISVLKQERDSALAMWANAEKQLQKVQQELNSPRSNEKIQLLLREIQTMQRDYSDAIYLLEVKLSKKQEETNLLTVSNVKLQKDLEIVDQQKYKLEREISKLEEEASKMSQDKAELSNALEKCLTRVEEAMKMEQQARSKVSDAVDIAQQMLSQQDFASEEKLKLQKEMEKFTESTNTKYKQEMESMMKKFHDLANTLESTEKEKKEISDEFERIKLECYNKLQEIIDKNKSLSAQCKELHHKSYTERIQWSEERKMLRTQIMTLQNCIEQVNVNLREQKFQFPCKKCSEMKHKASNYKKIASRWRKVAHDMQERTEKKEKDRRKGIMKKHK